MSDNDFELRQLAKLNKKIEMAVKTYDQLSNWSVGIDLHIEELEKKVTNYHLDLFPEWQNELNELREKVETLDMEKKLKIDYMLKMNQLVTNDKAHQALYDKLFKEIAELEKNCEGSFAKVEDHIERILKVIDVQVQSTDMLQDQLTELKEDLFHFEERIYTHGIIPRQLAKLDVGSARQTVDPCLDCKMQVYCDECDHMEKALKEIPIETEKKHPMDYKTAKKMGIYYKASGGENVGYTTNKIGETSTYNKNTGELIDSKPPEPNSDNIPSPIFIKNDAGDFIEGTPWFDDYGRLVKITHKNRLPGGTGTEPIEDEGTITYEKGDIFITYNAKLNKVVKREKIEFWRKELLNKTDEVLKSMREVLGIE